MMEARKSERTDLGRAIAERPAVAPSFGAVAGAVGGLIAAAGDLVALWGEVASADRAMLSLRLLATLVPPGLVLGAALGLLVYGSFRLERFAERRWPGERKTGARYFALPAAFVSAPIAAWIGMELFSGGYARSIPGKDAFSVVIALALIAAVYAAVRVVRFALSKIGDRRPALFVAIGFAAMYLVSAQLDQRMMPNLYAYLHACLAFFAWLGASLAALVALVSIPRFSSWLMNGPRSIAPAPAAAVVLLALHFATLDTHPNVRVALFDPRAATSRSFLLTLEPLMGLIAPSGASAEAIARAEHARALRRSRIAVGELPTWEGPHVLLVTIDALRADHLGIYGYERDVSPRLDALARNGVVFEHAYSQAPHSSYSISSLMTGDYLREAVELGATLPDATLASSLGEHGYHSASFFTRGIFHTEGERLAQYDRTSFGFESHDPTDDDAEPKTDAVLREADLVRARGEPPTFFWVHYFDVHEPYGDTRYGTGDLDRYDGEIARVDEALDRLIRTLDEKLERELIIVITADHGEEFREHGGVYHGSTVFEEQIRVPLIVVAPDLPARRVAAPVELVDVAPTVLSMVGQPVPRSMRGDDLRALMLGRTEDLGPAFSSVTHKKMVVRWPYKLIADFRFNLFQIFDLERDPRERDNLASHEPALLDDLKGEVYAWLDALGRPAGPESSARDPYQWALDTGRLDDRRALPVLEALVASPAAPNEQRIEAAALLGQLGARSSRPAVFSAIDDRDAEVRDAAVIALGRLYDERARDRLVPLLASGDPLVRSRAAISLGRLRDPRAVDPLIEALSIAPERLEREEAVRWLGRIRERRAMEPLLELLDDERLRNVTVTALGDLGDRDAFDPLLELLDEEANASVRDGVVRALGLLGDARGVPVLLGLARTEPGLRYTGESLVRLGGIESGAIGGLDFRPGITAARGIAHCVAGPLRHDWNYRERTQCATSTERVAFPLAPSERGRQILLFRYRRADAPQSVRFTLRLGDRAIELEADGEWAEQRIELDRDPGLQAELEIADAGASLGLDHLLLVPKDGAPIEE